jgi:polyisoprenoid-binding protein YceI
MKKVFVILFAATALVACKQNPKTSNDAGEVAQGTETAATYTVDGAASILGWTASKVTATHNGKINITNGTISVENGNITAGNFTIDMKSMSNDDIQDAEYKKKFLGHVSGADFFMVDSFPTATFEISKVVAEAGENGTTHKITGNLTIKGTPRSIEFPAVVTMDSAQLTAKANIALNRNEWGIVWGGKEDKGLMTNMKDDVISNIFNLDVNLVAKK